MAKINVRSCYCVFFSLGGFFFSISFFTYGGMCVVVRYVGTCICVGKRTEHDGDVELYVRATFNIANSFRRIDEIFL